VDDKFYLWPFNAEPCYWLTIEDRKNQEHKNDPPTTPKGKVKYKKNTGEPEPKAQRNFTDPESRIMKNSDKAFVQADNAQAVVDSKTK